MQTIVRGIHLKSNLLLSFLLLTFFVGLGGKSWGQTGSGAVSITTTGALVTENFNTLASSGTINTTLPTGWYFNETGSGADGKYAAGAGGENTGNTYSFGANSASERAFGGLRSGSLIPTIGAKITNNTGSTLSSVTISYTGEQWRLGATGRVDRLDFQYSTSATSITTGTFTDVDALDFTAPVTSGTAGTALVGNNAPNKTAISFTITGLSIANGASFYIRWSDFVATNADDGLGVDDFSISALSAGTTSDIVFTETNATNDQFEFMTLATVNLSNYSLTDAGICSNKLFRTQEDVYTFPAALTSVPQGTFVRVIWTATGTNDLDATDGVITLYAGLTSGGLNGSGEQIIAYTGARNGTPDCSAGTGTNTYLGGIDWNNPAGWLTTGTAGDATSYAPVTETDFAFTDASGLGSDAALIRYKTASSVLGNKAAIIAATGTAAGAAGVRNTANWELGGSAFTLKNIELNQSDVSTNSVAFSSITTTGFTIDASGSAFSNTTSSTRYIVVVAAGTPGTPADRYTCYSSVSPAFGSASTVVTVVTGQTTNPCGTSTTNGNGKVVYFGSTLPSALSVSGLTTGTSYTVNVYAVNGNGYTANFGSAASATQITAAPEINVQQPAGTNYLTGSTYTFSSTTVNTNNDVQFTIQNTGTATLTISGISVTGTGFSLQGAAPTTIAANSTATFTVRFSPTAAIAYNGSLTIASNDADESNYTITLNGTGTAVVCTAPTTQASNIVFSGVGSGGFTSTWTNGNGDGRIAYINTSNTFADPINSSTLPTANTVYSGTGQQAVYAGTGNSVTITGLNPTTTYYVRVYEYKLCSGTYTYQTATATANPSNQATTSCMALLTEDFNYGSVPSTDMTAVSGGNWVFLNGTTPVKFNYSPSRGLVYPGYASGGVGGSANVVGSNGTDIYQVIPGGAITTGSVYMAFLMNFTSTSTATDQYFIPFRDNNGVGSSYYGKLFPHQITGNSAAYELGFSKFAANAPSFSGTYNYGQTYLVVIKYQIITGASNDAVSAWIIPSGVPSSEATAGTPTFQDAASNDAANIYSVVLRQNSGNNGYVDGIRVGQTWADAVCTGPVTPVTYTWQPTSGSVSFATSTNWSPVRSAIRNTDILNFTNGGTSVATNVTGQGVGKINVSGNTSITLRSSAIAPIGINDDGTSATDLSIAAGSALIIDSDNPILLNLIGNATAVVNGTVTFGNQATVNSPGRDHRLTTEIAGGINFTSTSVFNALDLSGSAFSNTDSYLGTITNGVVFQSGSTYNSYDGSNPFEKAQPASAVVFNSGSNYAHLQTGNPPSFAGRTYGNFEYKTSGTVTVNSAGTTVANIVNNFTVTSGTLSVSGNLGAGTFSSQPINIGGNITINSGAAFDYSPTSTTPSATTITLNGTSAQTISGGGTFTLGSNSTLAINNSSGVTLNRSVAVGGTLALTSGVVTSSSTNLLSVTNPASGAITGGSTTAYISGPLQRTLPASLAASSSVYAFPVGKGGTYLPYSLSSVSTTTSPTVTAEAFNTNAGGTPDATLCGALSNTEYWQATASAGYTDGKVSLTRQTALGSFNVIGRSIAQAGTYTSLGGTVSGSSIVNSNATGSSLGYFVMATQGITGLTYSTNPASYCAGSLITNNTPSFTSGSAVSYSVTPALPNGLTLNPTSGVISGTPTVATAAAGYLITATNATGCTTTATVNITVNAQPSATISAASATGCEGGGGVAITINATGATSVTYTFQSQSYTVTTFPTVINTPGNAGTYVYTITDVHNATCTGANGQSVSVTINPQPTVAAITGPANVAIGNSITLQDATMGGAWTIDAPAIASITSSNSSPATATVKGNAVGTATLSYTVTNTSNCSTTVTSTINVYDANLTVYRTTADGNFSNAGIWEFLNGSTYVPAANPPGNSNNIQIRHNVVLNTDYNGTGSATFAVVTNGTLTIPPNHYLSSAGAVNFNGNLVTVQSDATGTGAIGAVTNASAISGATNVTVERYIPKKRAWQLITSPITSAIINSAWQEGNIWDSTATPTRPASTNRGTLITGYAQGNGANATSHGYDFWPAIANSNSSIRVYQPGANTGIWASLPSIAGVKIRDNAAYMLFVRGDRSITYDTGFTTLRANGALNQADNILLTIDRTKAYTLTGNPYASPINFEQIYSASTGIAPQFLTWDSKRGNYGAYILVRRDAPNTYSAVPTPFTGTGVSLANGQYIQSGEGFLLQTATAASDGTLSISEASKSPSQTTLPNPFKLSPGTERKLWINLNLKDGDSSATLADGVLVRYDATYDDALSEDDAVKLANFNENLGIQDRNNNLLIMEARSDIQRADTLQLKLWNVSRRAYQLQVKGDNFVNAAGVHAFLEDNYLKSRQAINLSGDNITTVNFDVNSDAASYASDRFRIVFQNDAAVLPVTLTQVKAALATGGVAVSWTVTNETGVAAYTVERSVDGGRTYYAVAKQAAKNGGAAITNYTDLDAQPQKGDNLYRIRIESVNGQVSYSQVVKVTVGDVAGDIRITLYPNPVRKDGIVNMQIGGLKQGTYQLSIYSHKAQAVYQRKVTISQDNAGQTETLRLGSSLAQGSYEVRLTGKDGTIVFKDRILVGK